MADRSLHSLFSISWQSITYGIGVFGRQIIIFLTLPLFTKYMSQDEYGAVSLITVFYVFLNTFTNSGLPAATFRLYKDTNDPQVRKSTIGASQILFFLFAFVVALGIIAFAMPLSELLLNNPDYARALQIVAVLLIFDTMFNFGQILLRIQMRPLVSSLQSLFLLIGQTALALLFVRVYDFGVTGYYLGYLCGAILGLFSITWFVRKMLVFRIPLRRMKNILIYGVPLVPATLSITALRLASRYLVGSLAGLDQVAIYDIGY